MKRILHPILFIVMLSPVATYAAFNDIGVGARPLGLGGAFVALADDSNAANYNAAGLGYVSQIQVGATTAQRFNGLITYNSISTVIPLGNVGAVGANFGVLAEDSEDRDERLRTPPGT